jgi:hypothetical protein
MIISFDDAMQSRNAPDSSCVTVHNGATWYKFSAKCQEDDRTFFIDFWATDVEHAHRLISAMRATLVYDGQILAEIPQ